ncbi:HlyD family efflux transporter periplasmic adaptor subunit [Sphaerotilus sp.]|uniref:HlyD family efflux transporter periplasmic adaptor subunit n=1 Tax=Sphaerotilus sp. TaxID=2093942 RepID=UPI002ACECF65|nr:HlyD family efflux transporter periplasmic adaptor subunit [Sphaerotilus sp.]MDZ7854882.1 HlyD family efflux transporter periplasmic adaptor subunit [Sphaerotilus sp.]
MSALSRPAAIARPVSHDPGDGADVAAAGRTALVLQALLLECTGADEACRVAVRTLAQQLGFDRVSLALVQHGVLRLVAVSDGSDPRVATPVQAQLLAALGETIDQQASVVWPEPRGQAGAPRITRAHRALLSSRGDAVAGVPLVRHEEVLGALCCERHGGLCVDAQALATLEALACFIAPTLALLRERERPWYQRLRTATAARSVAWQRVSLAVAAAAAVVVLAWPAALQLSGQARLEGAVQRVLSVPADGFVQQVHARPGDSVRAGQVLVELADQDLQLERQRWQSQLAQHQDAWATANARADRAQLVQNQSRADEAQAQLDLVEARLQRGRLVAPFDGLVVQGDLSQQLGAPVRQGDALMTLAPGDRFRVIVEVDERDIARVTVGQTGTVVLTALPWQALALQVTRISPVARAVEGRNVFEVEATLLERPADLRPGLQGHARIDAGRASNGWRWTRRLVESARVAFWAWWG